MTTNGKMMSRAAFVRSVNVDLPVAAVIALADEAGFAITPGDVVAIRRNAKLEEALVRVDVRAIKSKPASVPPPPPAPADQSAQATAPASVAIQAPAPAAPAPAPVRKGMTAEEMTATIKAAPKKIEGTPPSGKFVPEASSLDRVETVMFARFRGENYDEYDLVELPVVERSSVPTQSIARMSGSQMEQEFLQLIIRIGTDRCRELLGTITPV